MHAHRYTTRPVTFSSSSLARDVRHALRLPPPFRVLSLFSRRCWRSSVKAGPRHDAALCYGLFLEQGLLARRGRLQCSRKCGAKTAALGAKEPFTYVSDRRSLRHPTVGTDGTNVRGELMQIRRTLAATIIALATLGVSNANAAISFVGSWEVDQGPSWTVIPPAYSGQEAAAFLFGGIPSEYLISTVDNDPAHINDSAWVSTWGSAPSCGGAFPCGTVVAQDFVVSTLGLYESPGDTSAYVHDWAVGAQYTNFAFISSVPEAGTWGMFLVGIGAIGMMLRRRPKIAAAA